MAGAVNPVRPYQSYGAITFRETTARSRYNGLLTSAKVDAGRNGSVDAELHVEPQPDRRDQRSRRAWTSRRTRRIPIADYADARTDRRHIFNGSFVYELPFFATAARCTKAVLGGWQVAGIVNISSGQPVSRILVLSDTFRRGVFADLVGDPMVGERFVNGVPYWFNPDAFAPPAAGTFGNSGRAPFRQPGRHQWDINFSKNFYPDDDDAPAVQGGVDQRLRSAPVDGGSERGWARQHLHLLEHRLQRVRRSIRPDHRDALGPRDSAGAQAVLVKSKVRTVRTVPTARTVRTVRTSRTVRTLRTSEMPIQDLREQISRLPEQPGVYLYYNQKGETLYVGKARSLRDRTRSYLGAYGMSPRHDALLDEATRLEVIITDSVIEALALENNLIKQRAPRYNILLRDDKNYPYLQLTTTEAFPRVLVARSVERDGNMYAGPLLPAKFARRTMALTHKVFGIRSCNEVITGTAPPACLEYDIKRCLAPCVAAICSAERYSVAVADTKLFLEGRNQELAEQLRGPHARGVGRPTVRGSRRSCVTRCGRSRPCASGSRRWRRRSSAIATCSA